MSTSGTIGHRIRSGVCLHGAKRGGEQVRRPIDLRGHEAAAAEKQRSGTRENQNEENSQHGSLFAVNSRLVNVFGATR